MFLAASIAVNEFITLDLVQYKYMYVLLYTDRVNKEKCCNINYSKLHCLFIKTILHEILINLFYIASNINLIHKQ